MINRYSKLTKHHFAHGPNTFNFIYRKIIKNTKNIDKLFYIADYAASKDIRVCKNALRKAEKFCKNKFDYICLAKSIVKNVNDQTWASDVYVNVVRLATNKSKAIKSALRFLDVKNTLKFYYVWLDFARSSDECFCVFDKFKKYFKNDLEFEYALFLKIYNLNLIEIEQKRKLIKSNDNSYDLKVDCLKYDFQSKTIEICCVLGKYINKDDKFLDLYLKCLDMLDNTWNKNYIKCIDSISEIDKKLASKLFDLWLSDKNLSWCISAIIEHRDWGAGYGTYMFYEKIFERALKVPKTPNDFARLSRHIAMVQKVFGYDLECILKQSNKYSIGANNQLYYDDINRENILKLIRQKSRLNKRL